MSVPRSSSQPLALETSVIAGCVTFTNRNLWRLIFVGLLMGWNGFLVNPVYLGPSELISVLTHLRFGLSLEYVWLVLAMRISFHM